MKIYTKKGDKGTTGLLRAKRGPDHEWQPNLHRIQKDMMDMMSHLARPSDCKKENVNPRPVDGAEFCEEWIDQLESAMTTASDYFLLPGGNEISALCHVVRTQMRRGERLLVTLMKADTVEDWIGAYINRLSDLFFILARAEMDRAGLAEEKWQLFLYKRRTSLPPSPEGSASDR